MSGEIVSAYIAELPRHSPPIRFTYEAITKDESDAIRASWRGLDHATQVAVSAEFLVDRLKSLTYLGEEVVIGPDGKPVNPPQTRPVWKSLEITEYSLQQQLPHGVFAKLLWIVMGVHQSDRDPEAADVADPSVPSSTSTESAARPIAPAGTEKSATGPAEPKAPPATPPTSATVDASTSTPESASGTSTPDHASATSPAPEQTK